jgi:hypothetical protein
MPFDDALCRGEYFHPREPLIMNYSPAAVADPHRLTTNQIADLLAVVVWADILLIDEVKTIGSHSSWLGLRMAARLESLLVSVRPVADARAELAVLDGALLLDGFELWAARQRAVMRELAASSSESP